MRLRIRLAVVVIAVACLGLAACGAPPSDSPGVVLIAIDTLRPDRLSHRGHPAETSPNLDALAAESWVFEDAQSPSPWTAPALLSLMTSLYPEAHGVVAFPNPGRMPDAVTTLAEVLRAEGYRTGAFTEGGYAKGDFGLAQGFAHYPSNPGDDVGHGSNLLYPSRIEDNVDRALAWLERGEGPFFLFFHTYEAHFPYRAPEAHIQRFRPAWAEETERAALAAIAKRWTGWQPLTEEDWDRLLVHHLHCQLLELGAVRDRAKLRDRVRARLRDFEAGRVALREETLEVVRALYDAEIRFTDEQLGRLLDGLEAADAAPETLVVVVSDHGEGLGQHRRIQHGTNLHDELTRALLLIRAPGAAPRRVTSVVRTIDVAPTVLELLGLPAAPGFQGRSLVATEGEPRLAYASSRAKAGEELHRRAIRSARFTLIEDETTGEVALFDREADPGETEDVADRFPAQVETLRAALRQVVEETRRQAGVAEPVRLPAESEAELRALGYIE
jgi:arylsulfatase A-like enzyme